MNEKLGISQPSQLLIEDSKTKDPDKSSVSSISKKGEDLKQKRQKVEEIGKFNFFSDLGTQLSEGLHALSRAALSQIMSFVHQVLNGERTEE